MIERTHLAILRAIKHHGSLTAAAERMHLTQSALTHSIKKLEQQTGTRLWLKTGRRLQFTQAGNYLLALANRLLPQLESGDDVLQRMASGEKGNLRIGMECHPCYQWLLNVVTPYLQHWPDVDIDVKQKFQFGGMAALFEYEIDVLVTPDPLHKTGVVFTPVFDYEQVLVVSKSHQLAQKAYIKPADISNQVLFTYPVSIDRLDIFNAFLLPAGCRPGKHKTMEATEILLQMVASGRGVAALPRWLVNEYADKMPITAISLGKAGINRKIFLGIRDGDEKINYLHAFLTLAKQLSQQPSV